MLIKEGGGGGTESTGPQRILGVHFSVTLGRVRIYGQHSGRR